MRWLDHTFVALCLLGSLLAAQQALPQQGVSNLWMGGYASSFGPPLGGTDLNFLEVPVAISYLYRDISFKRSNSNITSANGELLFSTNGAYIANASHDTMQNGTGLSPSYYTSQYPDGLYISQSVMILPKPDHEGIYYLFHSTIDDNTMGSWALALYVSTIDLSLDGGLGAVVSKNVVVIDDTLNIGKITGTRHANGRDWWVICHKGESNSFYRLLVTPEGISEPQTQQIGIIRPADSGQVAFSPDGNKFAYYWGIEDLEIFNFDRCTGLFSDPVHIPIDDYDQIGGVAFSPSSRFLYASSVLDVYQFDTEAVDIEASMVHIAEWDSFYSPQPPFATMFDNAQLAPDGRIYIGTGNSTFHLHVVHDPNQPGLDCDIEQHGIELPTWYSNSLPNHPNYHLGPVEGSICDSLGINTGIREEELGLGIRAHPNPATGQFALKYPAQPEEGLLEVLDGSGHIIHRKHLAQWSTVHQLDLTGHASGMYHCRLSWDGRSASTRIIIHNQE